MCHLFRYISVKHFIFDRTCCISCIYCWLSLRELSLEEASRRPLLTGRSVYRPVDPSAIYPHVYDSMAQAKLTSAFVADSKVSLYCR